VKRKILYPETKIFVRLVEILALMAVLFGILSFLYFETSLKTLFIVLMSICLLIDLVVWQIMLNIIYRTSRDENGESFQTLFSLYDSSKEYKEEDNDSENPAENNPVRSLFVKENNTRFISATNKRRK